MALNGPWPTQDSAGASVAATRTLVGGEYQRPGIIGSAPTVSGRADGAYNVGAFQAVTQRTAAGMERIANDGVIVAGDTLTAPPASNSRIEVIWVRSRFALLGDSVSSPEVGVTLGVPAASNPVKPAIPAGAFELATARRYSTDTTTQTVTITVTAPYTAPVGGVVLVRDAAERAAWAPADGARAWQLDTGVEYVRSAGVWRGGRHVVFARSTAYSFTTTKAVLTFGSSPVEGALDGLSTSDYGTFTCVVPGVYQVAAVVTAGGAATTAVGLELFKNSAAVRGVNAATNTISWTSLLLVHTVRLAAGDTVSLRISSSGTVAAVVSDVSLNNIAIDYLTP